MIKRDSEINVLRDVLRILIPDGNYLIEPSASDDQEDRTVLRFEAGEWVVYYMERGTRYSIARFGNFNDAANYFYWVVTSSPNHITWIREHPEYGLPLPTRDV